MDPNATYNAARDALATYRSAEAMSTPDKHRLDTAATELADAFEALDDWLARGGFLPDSWTGAASGPAPDLKEEEGAS